MRTKTTERVLFLSCSDPKKCAFKGRAEVQPARDVGTEENIFAKQGGHCFLCGQPKSRDELRYITVAVGL